MKQNTGKVCLLQQAARDETLRRLVLLYSNHRPEASARLAELRSEEFHGY